MANLTNDDLLSSRTELEALLETAKKKEGHLSAGNKRLGSASEALQNLGRTQIAFGDPRDSLVCLKPKLFTALGVTLDAIQREKMKTENFYYLTMAVSMVPGDAVIFDQLKCLLEFSTTGKRTNAIIHSMFPAPEWNEILKWGGELSLGLNADLSWNFGLIADEDKSSQFLGTLSAPVKAQVKNKNDYKGFIVIPNFSFGMGRANIAATGEGNTFGYWDIQKPELKQTQTVKFGLLFKSPKAVKKIKLTGKVVAETSRNWLFAKLKPLLKSLSPTQQKRITNGFLLGDYDEWDLKLPI